MSQALIQARVDDDTLEKDASGAHKIKSVVDFVGIGAGTVAHGGTIPLPAGFAQSDCGWSVGVGDIDGTGANGAFNDVTCTANASRVVTCQANRFNWVNGATNTTINGTANYIIVGKL